jgi:hypothetical protein
MIRVLESPGFDPEEVDVTGEQGGLRAGLVVREEQGILG